uniref:Uncharacterized protein n=1 Tax=Arundo donax TaxID=35708 RepID=A0A0A9E291_ARUDO
MFSSWISPKEASHVAVPIQ